MSKETFGALLARVIKGTPEKNKGRNFLSMELSKGQRGNRKGNWRPGGRN